MAPHKSERLRFVQVRSDNDDSIWWPSLFYNSWKEMISDLSDNGKKAQAVMWFTAFRKQSSSRCTKSHWVTLLGKKRPNKCAFAQVLPEELDSKVKDFFFELEDMEILYCENPEWNLAKEEAAFLLEDLVAADSSPRCSSPSGGALTFITSQKESTGTCVELLSTTNATNEPSKSNYYNSSDHDFDVKNDEANGETSHDIVAHACGRGRYEKSNVLEYNNTTSDKQGQPSSKTLKKSQKSLQSDQSKMGQEPVAEFTFKEVNAPSSFDKSSTNRRNDADGRSSSSHKSKGRRRHKETNETIERKSPASPVCNDSSQSKRSSARIRNRRSVPSSPLTGTSQNSLANQVTPPNKSDQKKNNESSIVLPLKKRKILPDASWAQVLDILTKDHGFSYVKGNGIVPEYYVAPEFRDVSAKYIQNNLKEGKDYFKGGEGLKFYAHERYGWIGESSREFRPLKQKRQNKSKDANSVEPSVLLSTNRRKIESNAPWTEVFDILSKDYGFCYVKGSGICPDYYVTSEFKEMDEKLIQSKLIEGKDYFKGEEGLKAYAHQQYKWIGEPGREFSPLKRKRRCTETSEESQKSTIVKKVKANESVTKGKDAPTTPEKTSLPKNHASSPVLKAAKSPKANEGTGRTLAEKPSSLSLDIGNGTVQERLEKALNHLNVNRFSKETLFDGSDSTSRFRGMRKKILMFLEKATSMDNDKSSVMYVCGSPGLGKTTLVNHCVEVAAHATGRSQQIYLNASSLSSADEILSKIADKVGKKSNTNTIEKALSIGKKPKPYYVLVIDEIDVLIKKCSGSKKDNESALSRVFRWASDPTFQLALIGISNKIGSDEARLLHMQAKVAEELVFEPYTESDLVGIIQKRLGTNKILVEEKAIVFASRKVAKQSGDAREILDIIGRAVVACKGSLPVEKLSSTEIHEPVVGMRHVLMAARQSGGVKSIGEIIMELPQKAKVVLCVASALNQVSDSWRDIPLSFLKTMCDEATRHGVISENMSIEDFDGFLGRLEDDGLIDRLESVYDDFSGSRLIRVGAQLEDVEFAIQESSLLENPFYRKIVEYVRTNNIEP